MAGATDIHADTFEGFAKLTFFQKLLFLSRHAYKDSEFRFYCYPIILVCSLFCIGLLGCVIGKYKEDAAAAAQRLPPAILSTLISVLHVGDALFMDMQLVSANGRYVFVHQSDGKLVLYEKQLWGIGPRRVCWNSGYFSSFHDRANAKLVLQDDGNWVHYEQKPRVSSIWHSHTEKMMKDPERAYVILTDEGQLAIRDKHHVVYWFVSCA